MIPLNEQRRASKQLHAIADRIDAFRAEFRDDATKGTEIRVPRTVDRAPANVTSTAGFGEDRRVGSVDERCADDPQPARDGYAKLIAHSHALRLLRRALHGKEAVLGLDLDLVGGLVQGLEIGGAGPGLEQLGVADLHRPARGDPVDAVDECAVDPDGRRPDRVVGGVVDRQALAVGVDDGGELDVVGRPRVAGVLSGSGVGDLGAGLLANLGDLAGGAPRRRGERARREGDDQGMAFHVLSLKDDS